MRLITNFLKLETKSDFSERYEKLQIVDEYKDQEYINSKIENPLWLSLGSNTTYLVVEKSMRLPREIREITKSSTLNDKELRHLIIEMLEENLDELGWKKTTYQNQFIQIGSSTVVSFQLKDFILPLTNEALVLKGLIVNVTSLKNKTGEMEYYISFDTRSSLYSNTTLASGASISNRKNYSFSCPKYNCKFAISGKCNYSFRFSLQNLPTIYETDKITTTKNLIKNSQSVIEYYSEKGRCLHEENIFPELLKENTSLVYKQGHNDGEEIYYPKVGIRWKIGFYDLNYENRRDAHEAINSTPLERYNVISDIFEGLRTIKIFNQNIPIKPLGPLKARKRFTPFFKFLKDNKETRSKKVDFDRFNPISKGLDNFKIAIIGEQPLDEKMNNWLSDFFEQRSKISYKPRRRNATRISSFQSMFDTKCELIKYDPKMLPDAILVIRSSDAFEDKWRIIARTSNLGFKAMEEVEHEGDFFDKMENVGLGLYVSSFGPAWTLWSSIEEYLGIHLTKDKISICLINAFGNIIKSTCIRRNYDKYTLDQVLENLGRDWKFDNNPIMVSGMLYDRDEEKLLEKGIKFLHILEYGNGIRLFDIKDDRKVTNPGYVSITHNYYLVLSASVGNIYQGTPQPLIIRFYGNYEQNEKQKICDDIINLSNYNPWSINNYSKLPLPLHAAKRIAAREPIEIEKLDDVPNDEYNTYWFV